MRDSCYGAVSWFQSVHMSNRRSSTGTRLPVPVELIQRRIYFIRGEKVMLDEDLAELYHVSTKALNLAVRRNADRFPPDFMFQLTQEEFERLKANSGTSGWGGRRYAPFAFTEHGVAMLSSILKSKRAIEMNIHIIRAFMKLREVLASHKALARKIEQLDFRQKDQEKILSMVVQDVAALGKSVALGLKPLEPPRRRKPRIGFLADPNGR